MVIFCAVDAATAFVTGVAVFGTYNKLMNTLIVERAKELRHYILPALGCIQLTALCFCSSCILLKLNGMDYSFEFDWIKK